MRDDLDNRFDEACDRAKFSFDAAVEEVERVARSEPNIRPRFRGILSIFYLGAANERIGLHSFGGPLNKLRCKSDFYGFHENPKATEILALIPSDGSDESTDIQCNGELDDLLDGALKLYVKSIELTPENPDSHKSRARAFQSLADGLLMSYGIFPDYESPHARVRGDETFKHGGVNLGANILPDAPKPDDLAVKVKCLYGYAESDYATALKLDGTDAETYLNISHVQRQQGKVRQANSHRNKALQLLNKALRADNSDSESYLKRADIFEESGNVALAKADIERVLTLSISDTQIADLKKRIERLR
ncbi:MAG: hypothetical protein HY673_22135 [Chloroflexi bacterium]|nr:hypothetical protein [Chloroflexota bacterium]